MAEELQGKRPHELNTFSLSSEVLANAIVVLDLSSWEQPLKMTFAQFTNFLLTGIVSDTYKVKIADTDDTPALLSSKLVDGEYISYEVQGAAGANQTLKVVLDFNSLKDDLDIPSPDSKTVFAAVTDGNASTLDNKLTVDTGLSITLIGETDSNQTLKFSLNASEVMTLMVNAGLQNEFYKAKLDSSSSADYLQNILFSYLAGTPSTTPTFEGQICFDLTSKDGHYIARLNNEDPATLDWQFIYYHTPRLSNIDALTAIVASKRMRNFSYYVEHFDKSDTDSTTADPATVIFVGTDISDTNWENTTYWEVLLHFETIEIYPDSILPATMAILRDEENWVGYNETFSYTTQTPAELGLVPAMRIFDGAYLYEVTDATVQRVSKHKPIAKTYIEVFSQETAQIDPFEIELKANCGVIIIKHTDVVNATYHYPSIEITLPKSSEAIYYDIRVLYLSSDNAATPVKLIANTTLTTDKIDGLTEKTLTVGDRYILIADGELNGDITTK